ncbi:MAG: hypothetical protein IJF11_01500 [Clostridia bacterium]|nr:hypothetical protein [Clostridia bacterium]
MKRFLSIMLAILMLVPLFVFSTTAEEQGTRCTYKRNNVAGLATVTTSAPVWMVDVGYLVDGDRALGTAANSGVREMSYTFEFAQATLFDEIVMVVNSKGDLPASYQGHFKETASNNDYPITLKLYNGDSEIYSYGPVQTLDITEISTSDDANFEPMSATKIVITIQNNNANHLAALWEVEAYSGEFGSHAWQEGETVASDCETAGHIDLSCACGATSKKELPLSENHSWDNGTITTPATESEDGVMTYKCSVCEKTRTASIPATAHNAFDEGVVTAPTCTDMGYTTFTCTHCGTYTYKGNYVNALGHDMDEGTMTIKPTFTSGGQMTYSCKRDDCDYSYTKDLPMAWYSDSEFIIGADHATVTEELTGEAWAGSSKDTVLDGYIMGTPNSFTGGKDPENDNFWKAPCGDGKGGKLIIEFDYEYYLTAAKFYIYANSLGFTIEIFDAEGNSIYKTEKSNYGVESAKDSPIELVTEVIGQKAKKVVITSANQHNKSPWVTEVEMYAHKCLYDEADKQNVVEDAENCKTTFDGTCWMCKEARTGVVEYNHDFADVVATQDASCYKNGKGTKTCKVCEFVENVVIQATGDHDFENGQETVVTKNNCGTAGEAYKTCATEGCGKKSENYVLEPTGNHPRYNWVELEGQEADYTHEGVMGSFCAVCNTRDEEAGTKASNKLTLDCIKNNINWSIRYTDYVSPRANFKLNKSVIEGITDEYSVKVYGVVKKGEVVKEVLIYDEDGAASGVKSDGTFALVVKNAGYTEEYEFSVRVEITDLEDKTSASSIVYPKPLTTDTSASTTSAKDVATYFLASSSRAGSLDAEVKKFYELVKAAE